MVTTGLAALPRTTAARASRSPAIAAAVASLALVGYGSVLAVRGARNPLDHATGTFSRSLAQYPHGWANGILAGCGLVALAASLWLARRPARPGRALLPVAGVGIAALLAPLDSSLLTAIGYLPALLVGSLIGARDVHASLLASPALLLQLGVLLTAAAIGVAAAGQVRRASAAPDGQVRRASAAPDGQVWRGARPAEHAAALARATARTRRWTRIAMEAPLVYALTRVLMFCCVPGFRIAAFGSPVLWAGLGLAVSSSAGAALTWGLVRPWGERFPRWMVGLRGRRVPVGCAVVPGLLVAAMIATTSRMMLLQLVSGDLGNALDAPLVSLPMLLWPLWSVALAMATVSYAVRRRLARS